MSRVLYCADLVVAQAEATPISKGAVLVENDLIVAVGAQADFPAAFEGPKFDFPGAAIVPGLFDSHCHCALDAGLPHWQQKVADPDAEHVLRSLHALGLDLKSGVTTARCLADRNFIDLHLRSYEAEGKINIPRIRTAGRGLKVTHGHGLVGFAVDGPEEFRKAVRENIRAGVDFIKMYITGTVWSENLYQYPSREEIALVVEEAHRVGLPVAVHCVGGPGFDACLELGVDIFEHCYFLTPSQRERLIISGRWVVFTPTPPLCDDWSAHIAPDLAQGFRHSRQPAFESMGALIKEGARYAIGSDGLHGLLWRDIDFLCQAGASAAQALAAATSRGAELLALNHCLGSLAPGKLADLLVVSGNPLNNIRALREPALVLKGGRIAHQQKPLV